MVVVAEPTVALAAKGCFLRALVIRATQRANGMGLRWSSSCFWWLQVICATSQGTPFRLMSRLKL